MEEPKLEITVWTTKRDDALKKVRVKQTADDEELSPMVLDANRQKYKEIMSRLALRNAIEE